MANPNMGFRIFDFEKKWDSLEPDEILIIFPNQ
jgi:hypothetical protein